MAEELKIGACGIACCKCPEFEKCGGCSIKVPDDVCPLPKCVDSKGIKLCFDCPEFPCEKNYKGGPIDSALLDHWKKQGQKK